MDRSAAYAARHAALNVVASGLARKCQIQLAYAIGVARPVSILVETFGTGKVSDEKLSEAVQQVFDFRQLYIFRIKKRGTAVPRNAGADYIPYALFTACRTISGE